MKRNCVQKYWENDKKIYVFIKKSKILVTFKNEKLTLYQIYILILSIICKLKSSKSVNILYFAYIISSN